MTNPKGEHVKSRCLNTYEESQQPIAEYVQSLQLTLLEKGRLYLLDIRPKNHILKVNHFL